MGNFSKKPHVNLPAITVQSSSAIVKYVNSAMHLFNGTLPSPLRLGFDNVLRADTALQLRQVFRGVTDVLTLLFRRMNRIG